MPHCAHNASSRTPKLLQIAASSEPQGKFSSNKQASIKTTPLMNDFNHCSVYKYVAVQILFEWLWWAAVCSSIAGLSTLGKPPGFVGMLKTVKTW